MLPRGRKRAAWAPGPLRHPAGTVAVANRRAFPPRDTGALSKRIEAVGGAQALDSPGVRKVI